LKTLADAFLELLLATFLTLLYPPALLTLLDPLLPALLPLLETLPALPALTAFLIYLLAAFLAALAFLKSFPFLLLTTLSPAFLAIFLDTFLPTLL